MVTSDGDVIGGPLVPKAEHAQQVQRTTLDYLQAPVARMANHLILPDPEARSACSVLRSAVRYKLVCCEPVRWKVGSNGYRDQLMT